MPQHNNENSIRLRRLSRCWVASFLLLLLSQQCTSARTGSSIYNRRTAIIRGTYKRHRAAFVLRPLRGGAKASPDEKEQEEKVSCDLRQGKIANEESTMAAEQDVVAADDNNDDNKTSTTTTSETLPSEEEEESSTDQTDVPSLDAFINYDEGADALSSMAPILETTTTHVLDTLPLAHNDKDTNNNQETNESIKTKAVEEVEIVKGDENSPAQVESDDQESEETGDIAFDVIPEDLTLDNAQEMSSSKRLEGKQLHDNAEFQKAARAFAYAALLLEPFLDESAECTEDWSTCRLHEALCCLKADDPETAVAACTRVLDRPSTSGAVRARALYRRAKAYSGLEEHDLALQDARSAAFLGDRRGVALYGQLMRESPGASLSSSPSSFLSQSSSVNPMDDFASSSALFESLLGKSGPGIPQAGDQPQIPPFNPLSLLSGMGGGIPTSGDKDTGGLAKSVLSSLSKKLEDESTQDTICKYLQKASGPQIQQYAGMAGMELPESQAARIAQFLRGITPKSIRRTVKNGKRLVYGVRLVRKTSKVIVKYRNILIWIGLLAWAKSAFLRPMPVNKRAARLAAKQAAMGV